MNALGWLLYAVTIVLGGFIGWLLRSWRQELLDAQAEAARDAEWDREHGIGGRL
jgi:uncharacterized membrane protein